MVATCDAKVMDYSYSVVPVLSGGGGVSANINITGSMAAIAVTVALPRR
jgi:hypothetical protein